MTTLLPSWLPLLLGLGVSATVAARWCRTHQPRPAWVLALVLLPGLPLLQVSVVHDAFQYHATSVSLVLGGDFDVFEELFLHNATRSYNPFPEGSVRYLGVPLLQLPALALGHALALVGVPFPDPHPSNGFTLPYWFAITLSSSAAGVLALAWMWRWLAARFGGGVVTAAMVLVTWASALPYFVYLWQGWTTTYSLAGGVLLLLLRDRNERRGGTRLGWFLVGYVGGWLALIWPLNGLALAVPAVDLLARVPAVWREPRARGVWFGNGLAMAAGVVAGFAPQLAGWYGATGRLVSDGYAKVGDFFTWSEPHFGGLLFDFAAHGAFVWHPILAIGLVGLVLHEDRRLALGLGVWSLLHIYAISCWSVWWSAIGFGNRFLLALLPPVAFGIASVARRLAATSGGRRVGGVAAVVLVFANLALLAAYRNDVLPVGIRGPNYVPGEEFALAEVLSAVFTQPGPTWQALTGERWLHQTVLRHLPYGDWSDRSSTVATVLLVWGTAAAVGLRRAPRRLEVTVAIGAGAITGAACVWLAFGLGPTPPHVSFQRLDADERILTPGASLTLLPRAYLRPTSEVDVISFLSYGGGLAQGRPLALLRVTTEDGVVEHPVRAGIESVEVALDGPVVQRVLHDRRAATPVHEWITNAHADRYYAARAYLMRLPIEPPSIVRRVDVQHLGVGGDLVLRDVFLRE